MSDVDMSEVKDVWKAIKDDASPKAWVVVGLDPENKKRIVVHASGRCGLDKMKAALKPDQIQFGAFRVFAVEHAVKQPKFCSFIWTGPAAGIRAKANATSIKAAVLKNFEGSHAEFQFDNLDEITESGVAARLTVARGSHPPSGGYAFGTGAADDLEDDELEALAEQKRAEDAAIAAAEAAAAAAAAEEARLAAVEAARLEALRQAEEERKRRLAMLPTRTSNSEAKRTQSASSVAGYDLSALTSAFVLESLTSVEDPLAWAVAHVTEESPKTAVLLGSGSGGPDEVLPFLSNEDIVFGAIRVTAVDRRGTRVSLRARLVYFTCTGDAVSHKTRFIGTAAVRAFGTYFEAPALDLKLRPEDAASELSRASLAAKLAAVHPASEYKFGFYSADAQVDEYFAQVEAAKAAEAEARARESAIDENFAARAVAKAEAEAAAAAARRAAEVARAEELSAADAAEAAKAAERRRDEVTLAKSAASVIRSSRSGPGLTPASPAPGSASAAAQTPVSRSNVASAIAARSAAAGSAKQAAASAPARSPIVTGAVPKQAAFASPAPASRASAPESAAAAAAVAATPEAEAADAAAEVEAEAEETHTASEVAASISAAAEDATPAAAEDEPEAAAAAPEAEAVDEATAEPAETAPAAEEAEAVEEDASPADNSSSDAAGEGDAPAEVDATEAEAPEAEPASAEAEAAAEAEEEADPAAKEGADEE